MSPTEHDLHTFYNALPTDQNAQQRLLAWIEDEPPQPPARPERIRPAARGRLVAASGLVCALAAATTLLSSHAHGPRQPSADGGTEVSPSAPDRSQTASTPASSNPASTAKPTNSSQFRYVGATKVGTLIPVAKRKVAGPVNAELLAGKGTFVLTAQRGRVVVLNFWATWCLPCVIETPQFDALYRQLKSPTLQFVGLTVKDVNKSTVQSFVHDNDISYPIVYDQMGKTALQLGKLPLVGLPDTVVVDKRGRVAAIYVGPLTPGDLKPVLTSLTNER